MCDTVVITPAANPWGAMLFAKNSDREPNEAHQVVALPAAAHAPGERLRCTYIDIPQRPHTHAVLLAKPCWTWGAEMGVNEHGLAIGNEAVFTREPAESHTGLLGMDLLRLALERAATGSEGIAVIVELLETYGQGGSSGFTRDFRYDNSFLLADPDEAWLLETAGRRWAARQLQGVFALSNALTIGSTWDLAFPDLADHAAQRGWWSGDEAFSFCAGYSDETRTAAGNGRGRCQLLGAGAAAALAAGGEQGPETLLSGLMAALRDHGAVDAAGEPPWRPDGPALVKSVCMHAGPAPHHSQTTGSLVAHITRQGATAFFTGTAAPCTSIFLPAWVDTPLPEEPLPTGYADLATLFWRHEQLHRALLRDYPDCLACYAAERDALERAFVGAALAAAYQPQAVRARVAAESFARAERARRQWLQRVLSVPPSRPLDAAQAAHAAYRQVWDELDALAGLEKA